MAEPPRKEFGRRGLAPPVVTHAPEGLPGGANGPFGSRKRTIAIAAIAVGSLSIGTYAAIENSHWRDCAEEGDRERQEECRRSHSHGGSSGGHSYSSGSSSSSSHVSSGESSGHLGAASSGHAVAFGGFGNFGGFVSSGHGGGS
ncbi:hypothetical protein FM996_06140 [Methylosinus sporium]|uniref:Uncharacterized protein n=1 Tax=Methylosinus sporium TaxID=428 RepID=A0A549T2J0_METSR|nr:MULTISPECIES: hypothetical protein [Methylosinus]MBU3890055.1 hypothetical protein [Methylosinus sp. KRF6]TRL36096.1 hypothetical protein FM996_06140 [Methylosinus sporium]